MKEAETDHGASFLPVLRSQSVAIDDFVDERYGKLTVLRSVAPPIPRGGPAAAPPPTEPSSRSATSPG